MIERPNNWDDVKALSDTRRKIPAGAYECIVKQARVVTESWGTQLVILFDVDAGEFAGYYQDDFDANQREGRKWRGTLRQWLPKNDGSDRDEWTKSQLKAMVKAFEESNRGYRWNWDERTLKGKRIGMLLRDEEWNYEGRTGFTARPFKAISVDAVADGNFTMPKPKTLKTENSGSSTEATGSLNSEQFQAMDSNYFAEEDNEKLPF